MGKIFLVDVFNVLHKWDKTRDLIIRGQLLAAEKLFLNQYLTIMNKYPVSYLFFDGQNSELKSQWNIPGLKIIFCAPLSADEKIKSFIKRNFKKYKQVIIISDDREIQAYARRFDYNIKKVDDFLASLNDFESSAGSDNLNDNEEKPSSVSESEIEEYLKLMAKKNDNPS